MDMRVLIRCKLLELGDDSISSYEKAKQAHMRNGGEAALNDMIKAAILLHGICQLAEFTGVASYGKFEMELVRRRQESGPVPGSPTEQREATRTGDMVFGALP